MLKGEIFNSREGVLFWVTATGEGKPNYNKDGREYVASIMFEKESDGFKHATENINRLFHNTFGEKARMSNKCFRYCNSNGAYKNDVGEPITESEATHVMFQFHTAVSQNGRQTVIAFYDANTERFDIGNTLIGNGTIGNISGQMVPYERGANRGVSLFLRAIKIVKLVEYDPTPEFDSEEKSTVSDEEKFVAPKEENHFEEAVSQDVPEETNKPATIKNL